MNVVPARHPWLLAVAAAGSHLACSTVPPPVIAPGPGRPLQVAATWSVDWGFARAHIQRPDGTVQLISGNGDSTYGNPDRDATVLTVPVPALASLHQWSGDWDTGEYAGWRRFGATARVRIATAAGGATTSIASALNAHWSFQGVDVGVALEQSLPVLPFVTLLGRVGVSYGLRDYDIQVPRELDATAGHDNTIGAAHFDLLRPDLRVEPLLGVALGSQSSWVLSFQPYFVVARGSIGAAKCADCVADVRLLDFTQNVGIAFALTVHGP